MGHWFDVGGFDDFLRPEAAGTVYLDASPWGLGGILIINCKVHSFFACPVSKHDLRVLKIIIGDTDGQQQLEALVVLVAMRLWLDVLKTKRIILTLKSDNTSALAMASSLKITLPR